MATSRALGTRAQVAVTEPARLPAAQELVHAWLQELDRAASRFRADSDIHRVNTAGGRAVRVSRLCLNALAVALRVARLTEGLVDPTVGAAVEASGYDRDFESMREGGGRDATPSTSPPLLERASYGEVELDTDAGTVRVPAGVHLDLGSSAKAHAADECSRLAADALGCGVLVSLGGDVAVAGTAAADAWPVRVTDDHAAPPDAPGQTVSIRSGGLATSSTTVRSWSGRQGPAHHIIDPRTGVPARIVWRTASATAPSCVDANAAATAAIILGAQAPGWLAARGVPARLVSLSGDVLHLCGWPVDGEET